MKKTVLIKVTTIFKPRTGKNRYVSGIGRSTLHLLEALADKADLPFNIKLYGAGITGLHNKAYNLPFDYSCFPLPMKLGTELTKLEPWYLRKVNKHDILHIPHNYDYAVNGDMNFLVTMHDTCEYDQALAARNAGRVNTWKLAAERSKRIVTCSMCSKKDIIERFKVPDEKVVVIPWGISTELFHTTSAEEIEKTIVKFSISADYFLAVSCANERKNIDNLLWAYRNYLSAGGKAQIVLLWSTPPQNLMEEYAKEIAMGKIKFLRYVDDDDLVKLYNGALATMYPSRYEGFGFPILESFACGTPVMTCNNSSLFEVGGDLAVYVGEDNIDEMTQAMEMFSSNGYDFKQFKSTAEDYVKNFSWSQTADKYISFYNEALD